uniref:Copper transport protein n=1 Tax=Megaselia scalaris TaxID=36166 RepID=T1GMC6_MEGSC
MDHEHGGNGGNGGGDGGHIMMHMMYMTFHGGYKATILWDSWATETVVSFVFSCIGIFLISVLYEGLKFIREKLHLMEIEKLRASIAAEMKNNQQEGTSPNYGSMASLTNRNTSMKSQILSKVI